MEFLAKKNNWILTHLILQQEIGSKLLNTYLVKSRKESSKALKNKGIVTLE